LFRYFTNAEYEKARSCRKKKQIYEIHLIIGIGTPEPEHYVIPGEELLVRLVERKFLWQWSSILEKLIDPWTSRRLRT
jgi:hypothetical protein